MFLLSSIAFIFRIKSFSSCEEHLTAGSWLGLFWPWAVTRLRDVREEKRGAPAPCDQDARERHRTGGNPMVGNDEGGGKLRRNPALFSLAT